MRIDRLNLKNFKGFTEYELNLHPQFNLLVGKNGVGKTSILEALTVAAGSWFLGLRGYDTRHIRPDDVRLAAFENQDEVRSWEQQFPCVVQASGLVKDKNITWTRSLNSARGRTTFVDARKIKDLAAGADSAVRDGRAIILPLISYFPTNRLSNISREQARVLGVEKLKSGAELSRLEAYRHSIEPRVSVSDLVEWFARETWRAFQRQGKYSSTFSIARQAIIKAVMDAKDIDFDANYGEVIVRFEDNSLQPFNNLSDGQRSMLAMVGDLARKCATLNPHLGEDALSKTPGVVLIDELELHLHPAWQRRVVQDLKSIFPALQFIATTHSPQIISEVRRDEIQILTLDGPYSPSHSYGIDSKRVLEEVMSVSGRPVEVEERIKRISNLISQGHLSEARGSLKVLQEVLEDDEDDPEVIRLQTAIDFLTDE